MDHTKSLQVFSATLKNIFNEIKPRGYELTDDDFVFYEPQPDRDRGYAVEVKRFGIEIEIINTLLPGPNKLRGMEQIKMTVSFGKAEELGLPDGETHIEVHPYKDFLGTAASVTMFMVSMLLQRLITDKADEFIQKQVELMTGPE